MASDPIIAPTVLAHPVLAHTLRARLVAFLRPVGARLATQLDIRRVPPARDRVQLMLTHRHRPLGLLRTERGG